ncbi:MAG: hypothetical protein HYU63_01865, partial [Armatimonadetes bacterium]|nr:hypothetical protein [Armatimonadota bacterium]
AYPALMTAVIFISFKIKPLTWMLVLAAALGQVDLIDTLMHLHTPLLISILRIANGLIFGWVIGLIWIGFVWKIAVKSRFFG